MRRSVNKRPWATIFAMAATLVLSGCPEEGDGGQTTTPGYDTPPSGNETVAPDTPTPGATATPTIAAQTPTSLGGTPTAEATFDEGTPTEPPPTAPPPTEASTPTAATDADGDGYAKSDDCADDNAAINPGATEVCNDLDDNCDGRTDEADPTLVGGDDLYPDADGDGYGNAAADPLVRCDPLENYVENNSDCDDTDLEINPSAEESCTDAVDLNCDGSVGYADSDGDGTAACEDCDDTNGAAFPGAAEVCDEADNDCDDKVDEAVTSTYYIDGDGDGLGNDDSAEEACSAPSEQHVATGGDCDDGRDDIYPDAVETCDGFDEDCDESVDEDASDPPTFYEDDDGDGYGVEDATTEACIDAGETAPDGYTEGDGDCDDSNSLINPDGSETCDGVDEDCDDQVDEEASDLKLWYADLDADGYGAGEGIGPQCSPPEQGEWAASADDCDDAVAEINPGATEVCEPDGVEPIDNNCNELIDDEDDGLDSDSTQTWYADGDSDGYGDDDQAMGACAQPDGHVEAGGDCDDDEALINPEALERCDEGDDDCDGFVDEGAPPDGPLCPGESCKQIHADYPERGDGTYYISAPDGGEPNLVYCDMGTDGGGWTLLARATDTNGAGGDYEFAAAVGDNSMWSVGFSHGETEDPQYLLDLSQVISAEQGDVEIQYYCYDTTSPEDTNYWMKTMFVDADDLLTAVDTENPDFLWDFSTILNKDGVGTGTGFFAVFGRYSNGANSCGNSYAGQSGMKFNCSRSGQTSNSPQIVWYLSHYTGNYTEVNSCGTSYGSVLPYYSGEIRIR